VGVSPQVPATGNDTAAPAFDGTPGDVLVKEQALSSGKTWGIGTALPYPNPGDSIGRGWKKVRLVVSSSAKVRDRA